MKITLCHDCRAFLQFSKTYLTFVEGPKGGQPVVWETWQILLFNAILSRDADGKRLFTNAYWGLPKGTGKSSMGAALAIFFLVYESARSSDTGMQIYAIAASRDQARIVFNNARKMVEASPLLLDFVTIHRDALYVPSTGASFKTLSSDAPKTHGKRPSIVICDELHAHENGDLYHAMLTAMVTREEPLMITITNAGSNENGDSIWAQVYRLAKSGRDPKFHFYAPTVTDEELGDDAAWLRANPASWITIEKLKAQQLQMPPYQFERFHLNRATRAERQWLPRGAWEACRGDATLVPGETVILGLDLSKTHDSTAIVIVAPRLDGYHVQAETWACWPNPSQSPPDVHHVVAGELIPREEVFDRIRELCKLYRVAEVAYDPWGTTEREAEEYWREGIPMTEYPQSHARMCPASAALFDKVVAEEVIHGDDEFFTAQIEAATIRDVGYRTWRLDKAESRDFMDASIALAIALDRAEQYRPVEGDSPMVYAF